MQRFVPIAILMVAALPASAHGLKVFATVEDGAVAGYAFFVDGGRPQGATFIVEDADGEELYRGHTDDAGNYSWQPPAPADLHIIVDAGDGHVADTEIARTRFPSAESTTAAATPPKTGSEPSPVSSPAPDSAAAGACDPAKIKRIVGEAVARQVRPLLEAYAENRDRVRLADVVAGIGMILGLAGVALWGFYRRRKHDADS